MRCWASISQHPMTRSRRLIERLPSSIILIATPILLPIATGICGLDPIQFGIMVVLNCGIGLLTPPVGAVLFIGSAVGKTPMEKVVKATLPFYGCMILALLMVSFIPQISLIIPKLLGGYVPTNF